MSRKLFIPNLDDLIERYKAGVSENQLAQEVGVNRSTIRKRLLEAGINPRSQSESEAVKWSRMTDSQRAAQVAAAHDACRGRPVTEDELAARAKTREGNLRYNVSGDEIRLGKWLLKLGLPIIHNKAIGPYNCDIGTGPIIVEVWGGNWHPKVGEIERTKYILDAGYSVIFIDLNQKRFPLTRRVTNYIVSLLEHASANPTAPRQYWMVRGDGELIFKRSNGNDISLVPPFTTARNSTNGQYERIPR